MTWVDYAILAFVCFWNAWATIRMDRLEQDIKDLRHDKESTNE